MYGANSGSVEELEGELGLCEELVIRSALLSWKGGEGDDEIRIRNTGFRPDNCLFGDGNGRHLGNKVYRVP